MNINGFNSGVQGVQRATELAADASQRIARAGVAESPEAQAEDLVKPVIDLKRAEAQAAASARVIETENKTLGSLLDIRA